jgi:hypothetical protein
MTEKDAELLECYYRCVKGKDLVYDNDEGTLMEIPAGWETWRTAASLGCCALIGRKLGEDARKCVELLCKISSEIYFNCGQKINLFWQNDTISQDTEILREILEPVLKSTISSDAMALYVVWSADAYIWYILRNSPVLFGCYKKLATAICKIIEIEGMGMGEELILRTIKLIDRFVSVIPDSKGDDKPWHSFSYNRLVSNIVTGACSCSCRECTVKGCMIRRDVHASYELHCIMARDPMISDLFLTALSEHIKELISKEYAWNFSHPKLRLDIVKHSQDLFFDHKVDRAALAYLFSLMSDLFGESGVIGFIGKLADEEIIKLMSISLMVENDPSYEKGILVLIVKSLPSRENIGSFYEKLFTSLKKVLDRIGGYKGYFEKMVSDIEYNEVDDNRIIALYDIVWFNEILEFILLLFLDDSESLKSSLFKYVFTEDKNYLGVLKNISHVFCRIDRYFMEKLEEPPWSPTYRMTTRERIAWAVDFVEYNLIRGHILPLKIYREIAFFPSEEGTSENELKRVGGLKDEFLKELSRTLDDSEACGLKCTKWGGGSFINHE